MNILPAIYLKEPHARLIAEKAKTLIVKSKKFEKYLNQPIYFMEDNRVYGILKITSIEGPLPAEKVLELSDKHRITEAEWEEWWPNVKEVYCYHFDLVEVFNRPKYFEKPPGVQTFIREVQLSEVTPTIVTKEDYLAYMKEFDIDKADPRTWSKLVLLHFHSKAHSWFRRLMRGDP